MTMGPENLFWDTCVFIRHLTGHPELMSDLEEYVEDAKKGVRKIFYSPLVFAELRPSFLASTAYGSVQDFFEDFRGAFVAVQPSPNVFLAAGALRDLPRSHATKSNKRVLGTADAIHLMSCVHLRDDLGVSDVVFHTFDDGKSKTGEEGKCVSLLSFSEWYPDLIGKNKYIDDVCALNPCLPQHPEPRMLPRGDVS